jgi:hypothetical protein
MSKIIDMQREFEFKQRMNREEIPMESQNILMQAYMEMCACGE